MFVCVTKTPHVISSPRNLAAVVAPMKTAINAVRIDNPPRYKNRKMSARPQKIFQPGQIKRESHTDEPRQRL